MPQMDGIGQNTGQLLGILDSWTSMQNRGVLEFAIKAGLDLIPVVAPLMVISKFCVRHETNWSNQKPSPFLNQACTEAVYRRSYV